MQAGDDNELGLNFMLMAKKCVDGHHVDLRSQQMELIALNEC